MLRARLATAAVAIPVLLALILAAPPWIFASFVGILAAIGILEYMTMALTDQVRDRALGIGLGVLVLVAALLGPGQLLHAAIAVMLAFGLVLTFVQRDDFETGFRNLTLIVFGVLYVGFLLPHFVWLRAHFDHGSEMIVFLLATVMAGDSGGYFVGRAMGKHKLIPRVSPGKSIEGSVGILFAGLAGGILTRIAILPALGWIGGIPLALPLSWTETILLSVVAAAIGQLGDLGESVVKRTFGCKDSGWVFPGHGGVLDRIDSLLFPVVFVYYYLIVAR